MHHRIRSAMLAAAAATALATGCTTTQEAMDDVGTMGAGAATTLNATDRQFAAMAAVSGLYEVEVSRIAMQRGTLPQVRAYAQAMVDHHSMANTELMQLLAARGMPPPATLPTMFQERLAALSSVNAADFDRMYVQAAGLQDHQMTVAIFQQALPGLSDSGLRAWAQRTLPVIQQHLAGAQALAAGMSG
jgi:putative membrane protein